MEGQLYSQRLDFLRDTLGIPNKVPLIYLSERLEIICFVKKLS